MRGHGTVMEGDSLKATVAGVVERVNKLVSVRPLKTRYTGEIGDIVIGRIREVRLKVPLGSLVLIALSWKKNVSMRDSHVLLHYTLLRSLTLSYSIPAWTHVYLYINYTVHTHTHECMHPHRHTHTKYIMYALLPVVVMV